MDSGYIPFAPGEVTPDPVVPRDASTVMVVRDSATGGLEVLMLRKHTQVDFAPGAYVFPGGAVDDGDSSAGMVSLCTGRDDSGASGLLGIDSGGIGFWVAAVRECFEEAGILLAYGPDGSLVDMSDPSVASRYDGYRRALNDHQTTFETVCRAEGLTPAVDRMHYFSHWITPEGAPRRYDTRFFVGEAPAGQVALNDGSETVESRWISPADALEEGAAGKMALIFATMKNLEAIGRFATAGELVAHARSIESVPTTLPRVYIEGREARILLPGDPGYEEIRGAG